ncbi:MAG: carboxypeptidase regulatory-like domain-containing protein [Bradymonadales bacterium]|nr:carboxypeptidase regulatory-like domain-containing protein [Bradymonadales bacterium]
MNSMRWLVLVLLAHTFAPGFLGCSSDTGEHSSHALDAGQEDGTIRDLTRDVPDSSSQSTDSQLSDSSTSGEDATGDGSDELVDGGAQDPSIDPYPDLEGPCGYGNVEGRVCSPSENVWIAGARVYVETLDCDGNPVLIETTSDDGGHFLLEHVPSGWQTIKVERGSYYTQVDTLVLADTTVSVSLDDKLCFDADSARLAVVSGDYDSIQEILGRLGLQYDLFNGTTWYLDSFMLAQASFMRDLLLNSTALNGYDVLFLNCGEYFMDIRAEGLWYSVITNLRGFVQNGGSIYASDWTYLFLESAYPDAIDFHGDDMDDWSVLTGDMLEHVSATIVDSDMAAHLGQSTIDLEFPDEFWAVVDGVGAGTTIHIQGTVSAASVAVPDSPLLVSFQPESSDSRIAFTSFHNHQQLAAEIERILYYLVFML